VFKNKNAIFVIWLFVQYVPASTLKINLPALLKLNNFTKKGAVKRVFETLILTVLCFILSSFYSTFNKAAILRYDITRALSVSTGKLNKN